MKKKINYLILLLTAIFIVGCTNVEDASVADKETDSQDVTTVETNSNNSEKEETITTVVDEPVVEETPTEKIMTCSRDTNLLKLTVAICLDIVNTTLLLTLVMGTGSIGLLRMNMGNWSVSLLTKSFYKMTITNL